MTLDGPSGTRELIEVLMTVGRLRRTGILTIQSQQQIIGITFLDGAIVSADALNESLEEGLGRVLASKNLVSAEEFAALVAEFEAGGGKVTDLLIERSFLDRDQLMDALGWHNFLLCREVLGWDDVQYKFYPGTEVVHEDGIRPLTVEELLVRATEDLPGRGPLPGSIPESGAVFRRVEGEIPGAPQDELLIGLVSGNGDESADLLAQADGSRSIGRIAADTGVPEYAARLTFYLLERAGSIEEIEAAPVTSVPAAGREAAQKVARAGALVAGLGSRWLGREKTARAPTKETAKWENEWLAWPSRALGFVAIALLLLLAVREPSRFLLPFPWQESLRRAVVDEQTSAAYLKIDRAAKTAFLLDGHFPAALDEMATDLYLTPRDLVDPVGRRLGYASQVAGYLIYLEDEGDVAPGTSRTETITGNFLLDPEFVPETSIELPPLVLLD